LQIAKVLGWSKDPGPTYSAGRLPAILYMHKNIWRKLL